MHSVSPPGTIFSGRFKIVRSVGAGGTGTVYEALRLDDNLRVALKVLHRHLISNDQVTKRFHREAKILRELRGDQVVPLIESGEDADGRLYLALEYVDGLPLELLLSREGPLSLEQSVHVVRETCSALDMAHSQGVIHRDLKPANIMIEKKNSQLNVRVLDFGLAKVLHESGIGTSALTEQNMIFGTPEYMAPEQVRGDVPDHRSDVYSLGVILYELLTGQVPFRAHNNVATMTAHLNGTLIPPRLRAPERMIPPSIEAVTLHAMARSPDERYPTAGALRLALETALERPHDISSTRPPPPPDLGTRDTMLRMSSGHDGVDPLAATAPFRADVEAIQRKAESLRITPEQLSHHRSYAWVWVAVMVVAAVLGVGVGVVVALR